MSVAEMGGSVLQKWGVCRNGGDVLWKWGVCISCRNGGYVAIAEMGERVWLDVLQTLHHHSCLCNLHINLLLAKEVKSFIFSLESVRWFLLKGPCQ